MRVLFSTGSPARYMLPPLLGDEQVNCGPDWTDARGADGRVQSLATPAGEYDLAAIAAKLPPEQSPDVVVCLVDASWRNLPRNLSAFSCPRVLLIADTHHLASPLIGMVRYMAGEPFERAVLLYDRHHVGFFHAAGFRNVHWFPGLTFPHGDAKVRAARRGQRVARVAFVGQTGRIHPRRTRMIDALSAGGVVVDRQVLPQAQAFDFYGASQVGLNASLNADLNLRVFEMLAAGTALLTDRLAPESGLETLFANGRELRTYADAGELTEIAQQLLARPAEARALGAAGAGWFDENFGEQRRRDGFRRLVFDGVSRDMFGLGTPATTRFFFGGDTDRLLQALMVYEGLQELHRTQERVRVAIGPSGPADFVEFCATLPRVDVSRETNEGACDLVVCGRAHAERAAKADARFAWIWDADEDDFVDLAHCFAASGFELISGEIAMFARSDHADASVTEPGETSEADLEEAGQLPR